MFNFLSKVKKIISFEKNYKKKITKKKYEKKLQKKNTKKKYYNNKKGKKKTYGQTDWQPKTTVRNLTKKKFWKNYIL